jgi:hypothetical protein
MGTTGMKLKLMFLFCSPYLDSLLHIPWWHTLLPGNTVMYFPMLQLSYHNHTPQPQRLYLCWNHLCTRFGPLSYWAETCLSIHFSQGIWSWKVCHTHLSIILSVLVGMMGSSLVLSYNNINSITQYCDYNIKHDDITCIPKGHINEIRDLEFKS